MGRAGHQVGAPSKGVIFPKYRGDLLEVAVVTRRMHEGAIEATTMPRNPLDVLAQQIVAMAVMDRWQVDELLAVVNRAAPTKRSAATCSKACSACSPAPTRATSSPSSSRASCGTA